MSLDSFLGKQELPAAQAAPDASNQQVIEARRRARSRSALSGRRGTILGGRSGGGESVARKTLLGE